MEILLSAKDMCAMLNIKDSTLRKYVALFKGAGYEFIQNEKNIRNYRQMDVMAFRRVIELKENTSMTLEQAVEAVVTWIKDQTMVTAKTTVEPHFDRYETDIKEIKGLIKALTVELEEQRRRIERDQHLMEVLREIQETRKLVAVAKDRKWWEFWKNRKKFF